MNSTKFLIPLLIILLVAAASVVTAGQGSSNDRRYEDVPSGTLILPWERNLGREAGSSQKCMKVCKEWGESCIIDPRTGSRKCRRTCKQFGVECFD